MTLNLHLNIIDQTHSQAPWVIDEERVLSSTVVAGISQVLDESAKKANIHVRVIVVTYKGENAKALAKQKMLEVDSINVIDDQNKTVYLVLNASTHESYLFVGNKVKRTLPLIESISRIEQNIIIPSLMSGNIENAAREGSVALVTVLDQWPVSPKVSLYHKINAWLHKYHLMVLTQFLVGIAFLSGAGALLYRYLKRPIANHSEIDLTSMSLEERMFLNSIAYRQYQDAESDKYNS